MKKVFLSLSFVFFGCLSNSVIIAQTASLASLKTIDTEYKVKENNVAEILKYLASDELEGRETGKPGMVKAADYLEQIFKDINVKPYFKSYRDTLSTFKGTAFNIVGFIEGNDPVLKNEFIIISAH